MKIIAVNATALSSGGALTILNQFIHELEKKRSDGNVFYIFLPETVTTPTIDNVTWIRTKKKSWFQRILWDLFLFKRALGRMVVNPDVVISLQNTSINIDADQIIYLHQPLPFLNLKWKFFNNKERKLFLYSKFYSFFIFLFGKPSTRYIVQTDWMKQALVDKFDVDENKALVIKPNFDLSRFDEFNNKKDEINKNKSNRLRLFYPASSLVYKNHRVIIDSIHILKEKYCYNDVEFIVTFDEQSFFDLKKYAELLSVEQNIINVGVLSFEDVLNQYQLASVIVFPSYVETFGLPLLESALLNKKIVCSDKPFSKEILADYKDVTFVPYDDPQAWATAIYHSRDQKINQAPFYYKSDSSWDDFFKLLN